MLNIIKAERGINLINSKNFNALYMDEKMLIYEGESLSPLELTILEDICGDFTYVIKSN